MVSERNALLIYKYDYLGYYLYKFTKGKAHWAFFLAMGIGTIIYLLWGLMIWNNYPHDGTIIHITDYREAYASVWGTVINIPAIWAIYIWQANEIQRVLASLPRKSSTTEAHEQQLSFIEKYHHVIAHKDTRWVFVAVFILVLLAAVPNVLSPDNPQLYGGAKIWWNVYPLYVPFWVAFTYLPVWMLIGSIIRHFYFIRLILDLINTNQLKLYMFHPDQSNGLGVIVGYFFIVGRLLIVLGIWISILTAIPIIFNPNFSLSDYFFLILGIVMYIVLPVLFVLVPLGQIRNAIHHLRLQELQKVTMTINEILVSDNRATLKQDLEDVELLQQKLDKLSKGYAQYPFDWGRLVRFAVAYIIPILTSSFPFLDIFF